MKRSMLLVCALSLLSFVSAATLSVSGILPAGAYQVEITGPRAALHLKDSTIARASIALSEDLQLAIATRRLNAFFSTLGSRKVRALSLSDSHFALHLLSDVSDRLAVVVALPHLSIGVIPPLHGAGEYGPLLRQYTVATRWVASTKRAKAEIESSFSSAVGLSLRTEITLRAGPVAVQLSSGPGAKVRDATLSVRTQSSGVRAHLSFTQHLGERPRYSGTYQAASRGIESEISYTFAKHSLALGHRVKVDFDAAEQRVVSERWSVSYRDQRSQLTCTITPDSVSFASKEEGRTLSVGGNTIEASWVYQRLPWRFEVQVGPEGTCSLLWQFTYSTDRGS